MAYMQDGLANGVHGSNCVACYRLVQIPVARASDIFRHACAITPLLQGMCENTLAATKKKKSV